MEEDGAPIVAAPDDRNGALCAAHEGTRAHATCLRCGNFVCPLCLEPFGPLPDYCGACRERAGGGGVAWERDEGGLLRRWWQTTRDVVLRPTDTFANARPGAVGPALGYVAFTGGVLGAMVSVVVGLVLAALGATGVFAGIADGAELSVALLIGIIVAAVLLYPVMFAVGLLLSVCIRALVYHAAVASLGGTGGIGASFWTVSYLHAVQVVMIPSSVIQQIPIIGPIIGLIVYLAIEVFFAVHLTNAARSYHGLEGGRAAVAGWSTFLLFVLLALTCCCAGFLLVFSGR